MDEASSRPDVGPPDDAAIVRLVGMVGQIRTGFPSGYRIWRMARAFEDAGQTREADLCEMLNLLLHNSSIPRTADIGPEVAFAYGGIGLIVHGNAHIGAQSIVGSNVTLGGGRGQRRSDGTDQHVPWIGRNVYLSTGAKVIGGVSVGDFSIVGANAVVVHDVPPLSVVGGVPARVLNTIDEENYRPYRSYLHTVRDVPDDVYLKAIRQVLTMEWDPRFPTSHDIFPASYT